MNISCSFPGCVNPVTGQCMGYRGATCGRFYCAEHSQGNLCYEHMRMKAEDDKLDDIIEIYSKIAEGVRKEGGHDPTLQVLQWIIFISFILFILAFITTGALFIILLLQGLIVIPVAGFWLVVRSNNSLLKQAEIISETHPGFYQFFINWREKKDRQVMATGLTIAGAIVFGTVGAASSFTQESADDNLQHKVDNAVDDELNRRGLN